MSEYAKGKAGKPYATEQQDGPSGGQYRKHMKKRKRRIERRRAKVDPECEPGYGKYWGYAL